MGKGGWAYNEVSHCVFRDTGFELLESRDSGFGILMKIEGGTRD